jgi:hypothetical protein
MEWAGEEKRIQALFSESSLQDQSAAPRFERIWARAETAPPPSVRISSKSLLVIASAVLIVAASAFATWSWSRATQSATQQLVKIVTEPAATPSPQLASQLAQKSKRLPVYIRIRQAHQQRPARVRQLQRTAINEAALLSRWQSPTQPLMQFAPTVDLNSLPQLNQSVEALKQFLPANADLKKESNQ